MYSPGSVWWISYDFGAGRGVEKKYFVVLGEYPDQVMIAFATSNAGRYAKMGSSGSPCGCPDSPCYRIDPGQESCFVLTTFVQFDNSATTLKAKLDDAWARSKAGLLHTLDPGRTRSIMTCAGKSRDLPRGVQEHIARTLKSMKEAIKEAAKQPATPPQPTFNDGADDVRGGLAGPDICLDTFCDLMRISQADLARTLSEPLTETFAVDARVALEYSRKIGGP